MLLVSESLHATAGFTLTSHSVRAQGMGGVTAAIPHDAISIISNPALAARLGTRFDCSFSILSAVGSFSAAAPDPYIEYNTFRPVSLDSDATRSIIPAAGYVRDIGGNSTLAATVECVTSWGTDYSAGLFDRLNQGEHVPTGMRIGAVVFSGTFAYELSQRHAVGISVIYVNQWFMADGLGKLSYYSSEREHVFSDEYVGSEGIGIRLGYMGELTKRWQVGASYQAKISVEKREKYKGLLTNRGDLDIPAELLLGIAYSPLDNLKIGVDLQDIFYADAAMYGDEFSEDDLLSEDILLGEIGGSGFGWDDILVVKLGCEWRPNKHSAFRIGYCHVDQPIKGEDLLLNSLAPIVVEHYLSAGMSYLLNDGRELSLAITYVPRNDVDGSNALTTNTYQTLRVGMRQFRVTVGLSI